MSRNRERYPTLKTSRDWPECRLPSDDFIHGPTDSHNSTHCSIPYFDTVNFQSDFIGPIYQPLLTNRVCDLNPNPNHNELSVIHDSEDETNNIGTAKPMENYPITSKSLCLSGTNGDSLSFPCPICGEFIYALRMYKVKIKFMMHLKTHMKVICPLCHVLLPMPKLVQHINVHVYMGNCTNCPICFIETKDVCPHLKTHIHSIDCPIPTCAQQIPFSSFKQHANQHTEQILSKRPQTDETIKKKNCLLKSLRKNYRLKKARYFDIAEISSINHLSIKSTEGLDIQIEDSVPVMDTVLSTKPNSSFSTPSEKKDVGYWEKHTKGIGMKLMNKMGYVPGQGLGVRGDGVLKPLEAVLLPKRINLDKVMNMRASGTLNNDDKKTAQLQDAAKKLEERILDRTLITKRKELSDLMDLILANEDYLKHIQNQIKIETERLEKLANPPIELFEIYNSDDEMCKNSVDIVVISSDDEI